MILLFSTSCAVQKRKDEKDGPIKKLYHNVTAHYNAYFNADVLINESTVSLSEQYPDNYTKILPVFDYVAADNPQAVAGNLDEAIKKVTVVVNLHPESNWSDDCYLLAGKAQYLKQDYESAEETLLYMLREFSPEAVAQRERDGVKRTGTTGKKSKARKKKSSKKSRKKAKKAREKAQKEKRKAAKKRAEAKKKEREKRRKQGIKNTGKEANTKTTKDAPLPKELPKTFDPKEPTVKKDGDKERYFLKHRPAFQEGQLWMVRTYIERGAFTEAERMISNLEKDPATFKDVRRDLAPVKAHYHLKQKNYDLAIEPLKTAIELGKDRQLKARYSYILAQIYQKNGDNSSAEIAFAQAKKFSNSYDLEFSAQLNIIRNSWEGGTLTDVAASKTLQKMTKDVKNYEYRDQIYFLLADIALKDNDQLAAIDYLKSSIRYNEGNKAQKGESYLQIAQLYFDQESFIEAKAYYDSTLQVLPKTDERYDQVNEYANNLTDIAANLLVIQLQDSLLRISKMSDDERRALAFRMKKAEEEEKFKNLKTSAAKPSKSSRPGPSKSNYWAYNEKIRKKGLKDFRKRWGDRPLENNWRRSTRNELRSLEDGEIIAEEEISRELTDDDVKTMFKDVPTTPEDITKSEKKIAKAMLKLGGLYRDRLRDNEKSTKMLEERERRFPNAENQDEMYYYLYIAYTDLNNTSKAKFYLDKLTGEFPNSSYTRILTDPDFLAKSRAEDHALNEYYDQTYLSFENGKYSDVAQRIEAAQKEFGPSNKLQAKFALLGAMSKGSLDGKDAYKSGLREVIAKYPNSPEEVRAKEILKLLGQGESRVEVRTEGSSSDPVDMGKYKVEPKKLHYFIVLITGGEEYSLNEAKAAISNFNAEFYKLQKLRISPVSLGDQPMVVIRRFKSQDKAMNYYEGIVKNSESFLPVGVEYEIYPITQNNYRTILKSKSLAGYKEFFDENYLN